MTEIKPRCPKCGNADIHLLYLSEREPWFKYGSVCAKLKCKEGEHHHAYCRRCAYDWRIECLVENADE